jgi:hypothetical protein
LLVAEGVPVRGSRVHMKNVRIRRRT